MSPYHSPNYGPGYGSDLVRRLLEVELGDSMSWSDDDGNDCPRCGYPEQDCFCRPACLSSFSNTPRPGSSRNLPRGRGLTITVPQSSYTGRSNVRGGGSGGLAAFRATLERVVPAPTPSPSWEAPLRARPVFRSTHPSSLYTPSRASFQFSRAEPREAIGRYLANTGARRFDPDSYQESAAPRREAPWRPAESAPWRPAESAPWRPENAPWRPVENAPWRPAERRRSTSVSIPRGDDEDLRLAIERSLADERPPTTTSHARSSSPRPQPRPPTGGSTTATTTVQTWAPAAAGETSEELYMPNIDKYLADPTEPRPVVHCCICTTELVVPGLARVDGDDEAPEPMNVLPCSHLIGKDCFARLLEQDKKQTKCPICMLAVGEMMYDGDDTRRYASDSDSEPDMPIPIRLPGEMVRRPVRFRPYRPPSSDFDGSWW